MTARDPLFRIPVVDQTAALVRAVGALTTALEANHADGASARGGTVSMATDLADINATLAALAIDHGVIAAATADIVAELAAIKTNIAALTTMLETQIAALTVATEGNT